MNGESAAPGASPGTSSAALGVPRLPGTPERTPEGDYRFSGGGVEVVLAKSQGFQIERFLLDGHSALLSADHALARAPAGSIELPTPLDAPTYDVEIEGSTLRVRAEPAASGLRTTKRYRLDIARRALEVSYLFENTGATPLAVTSQEFWRVPAEGGLFFAPITKGLTDPKGTLRLNVWQPLVWLSTDATRSASDVWATVYASEGWVASVSRGLLLVRTFSDMPKEASGQAIGVASIVDRLKTSGPLGVPTELRLSVQSAPIPLAPGGKAELSTRWLLRQLPTSIAPKPGNAELLGFTRGVIQ